MHSPTVELMRGPSLATSRGCGDADHAGPQADATPSRGSAVPLAHDERPTRRREETTNSMIQLKRLRETWDTAAPSTNPVQFTSSASPVVLCVLDEDCGVAGVDDGVSQRELRDALHVLPY